MLGYAAISELPLSSLSNEVSAAFGETPIYLSTHGFNTSPSDTPANQHFIGAIKTPPVISTSISTQSGFFSGQRIRNTGEVELSNADGALDAEVSRFAIDGRSCVIKAGLITRDANGNDVYPSYSSMDTFFDGSALGWRFGSRTIRLEVRSNDFLLKIPVQTRTYAGTGGEEGGSDIEGRPKPLLFGYCENVTPVRISEALGLYQVHDGRVRGIDAVYDGGVAIEFGRNYSDFASLQGANRTDGKYDTCRRLGMFKLSSPPAVDVTADVRGDIRDRDNYVDDVAQIIERLIDLYANVPRKLIDHGSFASFRAQQPAEVGIYITQAEVSVAQVLNDLCRGVGGWWGFGQDGRISLGRVSDPAGRTAQTFDETDILEIERLNLPYDRPHYRVSVAFRRNWTPNVTPLGAANKKQFRQSEWRIASATNADIKRTNLLAKSDPPIESHFRLRADAEAEAQRLLALYGQQRQLYKITVKSTGLTKKIGDAIRIVYPRWGLNNGKTFLIVAVRKDTSRNRVDITCFG